MTTFITDHDGKTCPCCGDTMSAIHSNYVPMWSDCHDDVICSTCFYESDDASLEMMTTS